MPVGCRCRVVVDLSKITKTCNLIDWQNNQAILLSDQNVSFELWNKSFEGIHRYLFFIIFSHQFVIENLSGVCVHSRSLSYLDCILVKSCGFFFYLIVQRNAAEHWRNEDCEPDSNVRSSSIQNDKIDPSKISGLSRCYARMFLRFKLLPKISSLSSWELQIYFDDLKVHCVNGWEAFQG